MHLHIWQWLADFNPRSRVGSDEKCTPDHRSSTNFNPRSRVGSDLTLTDIDYQIIKISIRAPAWGATCLFRIIFVGLQVFQSALPRGERRVCKA